MSAASRRRGADAERAVVRYLRERGHEARRYLAGDGLQPGDIDWHPLICVEVKDRKASSWPSWQWQAAAEAPEGTVPVVVRRTRGVPDVGAWVCRVEGRSAAVVGLGLLGVWRDGWIECSFGSLVAAVEAVDA